jgi:hypothetical protein
VIPLVYQVSERDLLKWPVDKALRRYELAMKRLKAGH